VATGASLLIGKPVKWVEERTENLISTGFARDFHMSGDLALDAEGRMLALRVSLDSDNGAFFADAQPSKFYQLTPWKSASLEACRRSAPIQGGSLKSGFV
jgi:CO/xanthine dehydrogenase Mo-binding subunit